MSERVGTRYRPMPKVSPEDVVRFWSKVTPNGECLEINSSENWGYGRVWFNRGSWPAHRISYFISTGKDPGKLVVCHKCDNRKCVNPDHLYAGTQSDNINDCVRRGEYWLNTNCGQYVERMEHAPRIGAVHVIEFRAYADLLNERDQLKAEVARLEECNERQAQRLKDGSFLVQNEIVAERDRYRDIAENMAGALEGVVQSDSCYGHAEEQAQKTLADYAAMKEEMK